MGLDQDQSFPARERNVSNNLELVLQQSPYHQVAKQL